MVLAELTLWVYICFRWFMLHNLAELGLKYGGYAKIMCVVKKNTNRKYNLGSVAIALTNLYNWLCSKERFVGFFNMRNENVICM